MKTRQIVGLAIAAAVATFGLSALDSSNAHADESKMAGKMAGKNIKLDQGNGTIEFVGAKVTGDHDGGFKKWTGKAIVGPNGALRKFSFNVDTTSVWTDNEKLTGHLKSPDFFDVAKYPKATFQSSKIEAVESNDATHKITGVMNLHGVIKKISFPATIDASGKVIKADTEFVINRFNWDISYKGMADNLIKDEVLLKIKFEIPKQ